MPELEYASSATQLLEEQSRIPDSYREQSGICCFCGVESPGLAVEQATSAKYFSDDPLQDVPSSDHVCQWCTYAMDQRQFKQGHWIAHSDGVETPSTGDLLSAFRGLRSEEYDAPIAVYVTSSPIRSSHSYLWTPVNATARPLTIAFDRQYVRIEDWTVFEPLLTAVEDLRLHGFTFDEIRSGEPRTQHVASIGVGAYRARDRRIDPHRRTARLELALTLSRSGDDQPREELINDHNPL